MKKQKGMRKHNDRGSATVEYVIILPLVFMCIFAVIFTFCYLYQRSIVQSLADSSAEALAKVWGHNPLDPETIKTGAYSMESFNSREIYWQIKPFGNENKEEAAQTWIESRMYGVGVLKPFVPEGADKESEPVADVEYSFGFPYSTIKVSISADYLIPGSNALKIIGLGDMLTMSVYSEATVYDQKELINNTDYIMFSFLKSDIGEFIQKKIAPVRDFLDKLSGD